MSVGRGGGLHLAHRLLGQSGAGAGVMLVVNYPCISVWTLFGSVIGRWLQSPRALQMFNGAMAVLLFAVAVPFAGRRGHSAT